MDCSTIIVSYDTFELTRAAIATALDSAPDLQHEVVVVDNASPDDSGARLADEFARDPRVRVLRNSQNRGFSAANNQGAAVAGGDVFFFLNPDTLVHPGAISRLVDFIRHTPTAGAVGPRVLNPDGSVQPSALTFPTPAWMLRHHLPVGSLLAGSDRRIDPIPTQIVSVEVVKGCALAVSRSAFEAIGGWDESYFMYSEETELCLALREKGYRNYHLPDAVIVHYGGAASADRYTEEQIKVAESVVAFLRRHHPPYHRVLFRLSGLVGYTLRGLIFTLLAELKSSRREEYDRRRDAAVALVKWFASPWRQTDRAGVRSGSTARNQAHPAYDAEN